jgi:hypothetical protein
MPALASYGATFTFTFKRHVGKANVLLVRGRISGYEFISLQFSIRFRSTAKQLIRDRCVGSDVVDKFRKS